MQAMAAPVTVLPEKVTPSELREVLRGTSHNGFPVVRPSPGGQVTIFKMRKGDKCVDILYK